MAAVTVRSDSGAQEEEICHTFTFSASICHAAMGLDDMTLVFLVFSFKLALSLSSFTLNKRLFSSSSLSATIHILGGIQLSWKQRALDLTATLNWLTRDFFEASGRSMSNP